MSVTQPQKTSFEDVRIAFDTRKVLNCSASELEELLAAIACETISDPATRSRAAAMSSTMRELLARKRSEQIQRRPSNLSRLAFVMALVALLFSGTLTYYFWVADSVRNIAEVARSSDQLQSDPRIHFTLSELARYAPTIRKGTLQAWWNGEQARQVQRLEALARRQALAGDLDGAARTTSRADVIRGNIASLAEFEKPPPK